MTTYLFHANINEHIFTTQPAVMTTKRANLAVLIKLLGDYRFFWPVIGITDTVEYRKRNGSIYTTYKNYNLDTGELNKVCEWRGSLK